MKFGEFQKETEKKQLISLFLKDNKRFVAFCPGFSTRESALPFRFAKPTEKKQKQQIEIYKSLINKYISDFVSCCFLFLENKTPPLRKKKYLALLTRGILARIRGYTFPKKQGNRSNKIDLNVCKQKRKSCCFSCCFLKSPLLKKQPPLFFSHLHVKPFNGAS